MNMKNKISIITAFAVTILLAASLAALLPDNGEAERGGGDSVLSAVQDT